MDGIEATKIVAMHTVGEVAKDRQQLGRLGGGGTEVVSGAGLFVPALFVRPPRRGEDDKKSLGVVLRRPYFVVLPTVKGQLPNRKPEENPKNRHVVVFAQLNLSKGSDW